MIVVYVILPKNTRVQKDETHKVGAKLTLGLHKETLLRTSGDGAVDVAPQGVLREVAAVVVGLDVLLNSLTAVEVCQRKLPRNGESIT